MLKRLKSVSMLLFLGTFSTGTKFLLLQLPKLTLLLSYNKMKHVKVL